MSPVLLFILFAVLAFALFVVEVFVPGGIVGAIGLVSLLAACGYAIVAFGPTIGIAVAIVLILLTIGGFVVWLLKMPDTRMGKKLSLQQGLKDAKSAEDHPELIGKTGNAETDLRPSGYARIEGQRLDVVAVRGYIEKGTPVEVIEVHGARIVVRLPEDSQA